MKTGDFFVENNLRQSVANAKSKMSTQFMSGNLLAGNPSGKRIVEDSVKMGGYDLRVKKSSTANFDMKQPMAGYSEFWIG